MLCFSSFVRWWVRSGSDERIGMKWKYFWMIWVLWKRQIFTVSAKKKKKKKESVENGGVYDLWVHYVKQNHFGLWVIRLSDSIIIITDEIVLITKNEKNQQQKTISKEKEKKLTEWRTSSTYLWIFACCSFSSSISMIRNNSNSVSGPKMPFGIFRKNFFRTLAIVYTE